MNEQEIQARYALDVAAVALNDALGLPLEIQHALSTPLTAALLKDCKVNWGLTSAMKLITKPHHNRSSMLNSDGAI